MALLELNCTDVRSRHVVLLNDFLAIPMSGSCCRPAVVVWVNGQIALACSVGRSVAVCDGFGILRITYGRRCFRNTRDAGCTLTRAKGRGINPGFTQKVSSFYCHNHGRQRRNSKLILNLQDGAEKSHIALPFPSMARPTSPDDMFEAQPSMACLAPVHLKRCCCG